MKYMGSKRAMLRNGLGELLTELVPEKERFFDLFCGTGSVAGYVAQRFHAPVYAGDLQQYAVTLAASLVERTDHFVSGVIATKWIEDARQWLEAQGSYWQQATQLRPVDSTNCAWRAAVASVREFCGDLPSTFPIARAYGGYYYSPVQAMELDALRISLPSHQYTAALAALIDAASSCAAAPGHTAQPFSTKRYFNHCRNFA
jgi:adenine-specific DNA-methyltransferase